MAIEEGSSPKTLIILVVLVCCVMAFLGYVVIHFASLTGSITLPQSIDEIFPANDPTVSEKVIPAAVATTPPLRATVAPVAEISVGKKLYLDKGCAVCHSLDGKKFIGSPLKGVYGQQRTCRGKSITADDRYLEIYILDHTACDPQAKKTSSVPPYAKILTPENRRAIIEFIKSL